MSERASPWLLEVHVVRVPGGRGCCVQAKHEDGDVWHHAHTFPGTRAGQDQCLLLALKVAGAAAAPGWTPNPRHWCLVQSRAPRARLPDAKGWKAWLARTGRA